jgi:hypothetical protein
MMLDHADELFRPGDERVASLFVWHFTEEIEHRSSALIIYNHVVGRPWYRIRQLPAMNRHLAGALNTTLNGFNEHVPLADRMVDARSISGLGQLRHLWHRVPLLGHGAVTSYPPLLGVVSIKERLGTLQRLLASQTPYHDPMHQPLPELAAQWTAGYERGGDVSNWFSSQGAA